MKTGKLFDNYCRNFEIHCDGCIFDVDEGCLICERDKWTKEQENEYKNYIIEWNKIWNQTII